MVHAGVGPLAILEIQLLILTHVELRVLAMDLRELRNIGGEVVRLHLIEVDGRTQR